MPVTLATQEAEIRRSCKIVCETLSWKKKHHKNRAGGVTQGIGPESKPQH
jgi:hypothetical protein